MDKRILITGAAGFIGAHLQKFLVDNDWTCLGIDNYNSHLYDYGLKKDRVDTFDIEVRNIDLRDRERITRILYDFNPTHVIHLAAYAGVRDSFGKEMEYHSNNIDGTQMLIESCIDHNPDIRIIYASTSSVYAGCEVPFTEDKLLHMQLNPYSWSKRTNECQFTASKLHTIGLRFFTVYGPWGRPDMALFTFTKKILDGEPIDVYNYGDMKRDFTYIDDIVQGIMCVLKNDDIPSNEIFNIGRGEQVELMDFISEIERNVGKIAEKNLLPRHPADALETWSDTTKLQSYGYQPTTSVAVGVKEFYKWYYRRYNEDYNGRRF
jgi:UDP-glucuronate 4-epimerase